MVRILFPMAVLFGLLRSENIQAQSLFGSSGSGSRSSSSGMGSTGVGSMTSAGSATGSSSRSGGSSNSSSGTGGQAAAVQSSLNTGYGTVGAQIGTSTFTGRGTNTSFIGASTATNQNGRSGAQNFFSQLQSFASRNQGGNNSTNTSKVLMRPTVQLGFAAPEIADPAAMQNSLQSSLIAIPEFGPRASGVMMAIDGAGVVTLSGTVANEDDRRMTEILTRLEPGVRDVKNELQVAP